MRDILTTSRLSLRSLELTDAPVMAKLMNKPEILHMTASVAPTVFTLSKEFWILRQQAQRKRGLGFAYAITDQANGDFMGVMDLFANREGDKEIGYWIGKPYWGKGYITEAAIALIKESFSTLPIEYIDAGYFDDNPASGRVLSKLGFVEKPENSNIFSIARGRRASGIELRLQRKTAMNMLEQDKAQAML